MFTLPIENAQSFNEAIEPTEANPCNRRNHNTGGLGTLSFPGAPPSPLPESARGNGMHQIPDYFYEREKEFWDSQQVTAQSNDDMERNYMKAVLYFNRGNFEDIQDKRILGMVALLMNNPDMSLDQMIEMRANLVKEIEDNGKQGSAQ